jgi:uncharacterized protein (TIGR03066 family)
MRVVRIAALACFVLLLGTAVASAQAKPQDLIIGKWSSTDPKDPGILEFTKDGKLLISAGQIKIEGTYKFNSDTEMEVALTFGGETKKEKLKVKVTKDELTTTDSGGKEDKFKRAK